MSDLYSAARYLPFVIIITIFVKPLGEYLECVFVGKRTLLDCLLIVGKFGLAIPALTALLGRQRNREGAVENCASLVSS